MLPLIAGAVIGGLAVWYWGEDLRRYGSARGRAMRMRAADAIQAVQETTGDVIDTAKQRVGSTLKAGQDAIRPPGS